MPGYIDNDFGGYVFMVVVPLWIVGYFIHGWITDIQQKRWAKLNKRAKT